MVDRPAEPNQKQIPDHPYGEIVHFLLQEKVITQKQIAYVQRIQGKLPNPRPMMHILKELNHITDGTLWATIRKHQVSLRIGSLLVELGLLTSEDLEQAFEIQAEETPKRKIGEVLVAHRFINERKMAEVLSLQLGFPFVEPEFMEIDTALFNKVPSKMYADATFIPISKDENGIHVAFIDPTDNDDLQNKVGFSDGTDVDLYSCDEAVALDLNDVTLAQLEIQVEDSLRLI